MVVYNVGSTDHPVGELFTGVDDGQYHVVRFTRDGQNATIQLDGLPVQPKYPTGINKLFVLSLLFMLVTMILMYSLVFTVQ